VDLDGECKAISRDEFLSKVAPPAHGLDDADAGPPTALTRTSPSIADVLQQPTMTSERDRYTA
jgi:hypothetical protein